jgi:cytochrome c-type biogenesis protein CcsB
MKRFHFLFTPVMMAILILVLAMAMAVATFIENDFGPDTARAMVYNTHWFELLFLLLVINLAGQIITCKLYRKEKLTIMAFHLAFIVMITGAAITRYTGYDGMMHIREGETTTTTFSSGNEITFEITGKDKNLLASYSKPLTLTAGRGILFSKTLRTGSGKVRLTVDNYFPQAARQVKEIPGGVPVVSFIVTPDMMTSELIVMAQGETGKVGGMIVGFDTGGDINVNSDNGSFYIRSGQEIKVTIMQDMRSAVFKPDTLIALGQGTVYTIGGYKIMPQMLTMSGEVVPVAAPAGMQQSAGQALECTITGKGFERKIFLWEDPELSSAEWSGKAGDLNAKVCYGSRIVSLPFSLRLDDFMVEHYPGSNSPSGFKSRVRLLDNSRNTEFGFDIYMNHVLKYRGYRLYQSSYDGDEKGTVLSVNHDPAGMIITYTGYALLFIFIVLSIVNRKSFFRSVRPGFWHSRYRKPATAVIVLFLLSSLNPVRSQKLVVEKHEADRFGEVLAQDQKGRTKPLYTISSDILRKVAKENNFNTLSSMQVFLGYSLDFYHWQDVPLIKISNDELRDLLGLKGDRAAFTDFVKFGDGGSYRLASYVEKAYAKPESRRSRFDKEVIKTDEKVNICYMMSQGDFMRIFPLRDSTDRWGAAEAASQNAASREDSLFILSVVPLWVRSVTDVGWTGAGAGEYIEALKQYQRKYSGYDLPSENKVRAELFYYKAGIFEKLFPFYATVGLVMVVTLIIKIIRGRSRTGVFLKILTGLVAAGFAFHTAGLGIRWYISGHSPMSNGYESMIFISWVTMLAGFIFSRRSLLTLAATSVLAGMTLMVAHLSFMDPEITNLMPVLRSYWLTLHVSVITGSYGFLGLGAILSLLVMLMMLFVNDKNRERISYVIDELTTVNFRTLTLGLYFLTIGTFLGAVWANESWGRYWGWDPKETWSLITIIVYTLVTHSRMIPGMKDIYIFNLISLFAFSSVLMTYFGVNYYLSGLHSYAGGEAVPVPVFVYVTVAVLVALVAVAGYRYRRISIKK